MEQSNGSMNLKAFIYHQRRQRRCIRHYSSIQVMVKSRSEGDKVSFEIENGPKGPKAINVVKE
jgi:cold shock CspA family protein